MLSYIDLMASLWSQLTELAAAVVEDDTESDEDEQVAEIENHGLESLQHLPFGSPSKAAHM